METRPPAVVERIVTLLVPPLDREHVMGDLCERFVSTRQYLFDALRVVPHVVASRIRRTTHIVGIAFLAFLFWAGFFHGAWQASWEVAAIPTLAALAALVLRGAYRVPGPATATSAAVDVLIYAGSVGLIEILLSSCAPHLVLGKSALTGGFPISCVLLFFMRLQGPGAQPLSPTAARSISLEELTRELQSFQATGLRSVRIEIGACIVVALLFSVMAWAAPSAATRAGLALIVCGAIFVGGFLYRLIRHRAPLPAGADFGETLAAYRAGLQRAHGLSRTYAFWYVLPLMIGPLVIVIGEGIRRSDPKHVLVGVTFIAVMGGLLIALHSLVARGVKKRLDQLAVTSEKGLLNPRNGR
jgi:hypothetical protein